MQSRWTPFLLAGALACFLFSVGVKAAAEATEPKDAAAGIDWNSLELQATDTSSPQLSDNLIPRDRGFRLAMARHGWALRVNGANNYYQNALDAPVDSANQVYVGQRGTTRFLFNPFLTSNLKWMGLKDAQFVGSFGVNYVNWKMNGPSGFAMHDFYLYKGFLGKRLEIKAGYIANDWEFICLQVGGSIASGSQGVYAVLPNEVGLSRYILPAPSMSVRAQYTPTFYTKFGVQRSLDPDGGQKTIDRNSTGFRFAPKGDKLLTQAEFGYKQPATAKKLYTWVRTGFLYNTSAYKNFVTGGRTSGNRNVFALMDQQLNHAAKGGAANGDYVGVTAMANPRSMNIYSRYFELRYYRKGTFAGRPRDMFSVVATHTEYSPDYTRNLAAAGKSFWRNATTISTNYVYRVRDGMTAGVGMTYNTSPAVTPKVDRALIPSAQVNYFF